MKIMHIVNAFKSSSAAWNFASGEERTLTISVKVL